MLRQKLYALALFAISVLCIILGAPEAALFTVPAGLLLFFSKRNWIY